MAELHALLPRSQLQIFRNAMHGLPFSHAAECAQTLLAFLAQLRRDR
jgi:pimeloyl-ACP methyl ester carboxylesterase